MYPKFQSFSPRLNASVPPTQSLGPGLVEEKGACCLLQQAPGRSGLQVASVFRGAPCVLQSALSCLPDLPLL